METIPPPNYSFNGDASSCHSPSPPASEEELVSAQSHSSHLAAAEATVVEQQPPDDSTNAQEDPPQNAESSPHDSIPSSNTALNQCYPGHPYPLPFPQLRPPPAHPASSEARISTFPDHKFESAAPLLRRLSNATPAASSSALSSSQKQIGGAPLRKLNPTNYVSLYRKTHKRNAFSLSSSRGASIRGTFAVDPFLQIPETLLSPLDPGETFRKNLVLKVENGGIDVDVHLVGEREPTLSNLSTAVPRTELHFEICGGGDNTFPLLAKIHTATLRRPPFRATLLSRNGFTSLHLPPSFHGLLTVHVAAGDLNNHITLSAALNLHATILSEDSTSRMYFIGALGSGRWEGDRAEVKVERGRVRVQFSGGRERDWDGLRRVGWEWMGF
ncbi:hypothetical protein R3P38DRAFT_3258874 [Favolaschia claudopus]|uniref:DUF7330 domain-containing protein n=1 Tax=Favolaschia claudopus TaxID=2862362 RepID=A0AAW0CXI6_9AGAR